MMRIGRWLTLAALLAATLGACAQLGAQPGDVGFPRRGGAVVQGEVQSVNTRSARIQIRQDRGGNQTIRYDARTTVVFRQQRFPVTALERGDRVTVRVVHDRRGQPIADRIDVRESARGRAPGRAAARIERVEGTVSWVDSRRGAFGIAVRRGGTLTVHAAQGLSRSDRQRLDRLRRGSNVRVDVRPVGRNQFELVRFR